MKELKDIFKLSEINIRLKELNKENKFSFIFISSNNLIIEENNRFDIQLYEDENEELFIKILDYDRKYLDIHIEFINLIENNQKINNYYDYLSRLIYNHIEMIEDLYEELRN